MFAILTEVRSGVFNFCASCKSAMLSEQQSLSVQQWKETMRSTHNFSRDD